MKTHFFIIIILFSGIAFFSEAQTVEIKTDELATETVLPIFDRNVSVLNRTIDLGGRFELGAFYGMVLMDPFFNQGIYGIIGSYHFDQIHGVNLVGVVNIQGDGQYSDALREQRLHLEKTPQVKNMTILNYEYTTYYGKMSVSKHGVIHTTMSGLLGLGMIDVGGKYNPLLNFGVGENFYFTKNVSLRADLRFMMYQGPNPISEDVVINENAPNYEPDDFNQQLIFSSQLGLALVFLF